MTHHYPVGIRSLAISLPSIRRTNDYYRKKYPDLIAQAEQKSLARWFSFDGSIPSNEFDLEMMPYLTDPFRGTIQRWVLAPNESQLMLQCRTVKDGLAAAKLSLDDVDLMIVASVWPEKLGLGDAAFLARQLQLQGAAWNLDATCGSTLVALQSACAFVRAGEYRNILVVISCSYSHFVAEDDTASWFLSDGVGALVISPLESQQGVLGTKTIHTDRLCDLIYPTLKTDREGNPGLYMQVSKNAGQLTRETSVQFLRTCCEGALSAAGVTFEEINFFIFNTPTAWFARFCIRVLGIDPKRTIDLYPQFANIGPVLSIVNLYYAERLGKIQENDLVLVYGFGTAGAASASVMRWSKVALGPDPLQELDVLNKN
ncbi:3-oxoacyl-ACP synthase [Aetokthonos hydrillicola Thurmond2011]|uniref:3-oxoacyl-ACP synthase n=1 Tax=Aetokthonos hydrillicola Thurmond2011 TaxID=2712845 RepID=A0AAP5I4B3_9CYAN|nr:3-oxoacyl-[acyl-carrier-protein] synthase III C-terminal domain-containing protein [Aetokthonos hydrillicola]MBO3459422.1 3-oxoacyl-ACP synthase [Aetokthonos hydrillicola CCALA 1050]MBW4586568.1 3-oxoacyl-ACP synthase [Aetokthonos hydrillicola CCALA 1050]MDR9893487.1 3-oxoacyl-ACP synthase [Aetokthonos hydrillicola Thurmond2011]